MSEERKIREDAVDRMLRRITLRERLAVLLAGLFVMLGFCILWLTVAAHVDCAVSADDGNGLRVSTRIYSLAALGSLLCIAAVALVIIFFRRTNSLAMARRIELQFPQFRHSLVTYLEMRRRGVNSHEEFEIGQGVGRTAASHLKGVRSRDVSDRKSLWRALAFAVACLLIVALSILVGWDGFLASFERVAWPRAAQSLVANSTISEVEPGNRTVLRNSDIKIRCRLGEKTPATATLVFVGAGGEQRLEARASDDRRCEWPFTAVERDFKYRIHSGGAVSNLFQIKVVDIPAITGITVRNEFPAYMGIEPRTDNGGDIVTYEGAKVTINALTNKPVTAASAEPLARVVDIAQDRRGFVASFVARASGNYQLWFKDEDGFEPPELVRHSLMVQPDRPPTARFTDPGRDIELTTDDVAVLQLEAEDDFGVGSIVFSYELRGLEHKMSLPLAPRARRCADPVTLVMKALDARPGDRIRYYAVAADNKPEPNTVRTNDFYITIKAPEERQENPPLDKKEIEQIAQNADPFEKLKQELSQGGENQKQDAGQGESQQKSSGSQAEQKERGRQGGQEQQGQQNGNPGEAGKTGEVAKLAGDAANTAGMSGEQREQLAKNIDTAATELQNAAAEMEKQGAQAGKGEGGNGDGQQQEPGQNGSGKSDSGQVSGKQEQGGAGAGAQQGQSGTGEGTQAEQGTGDTNQGKGGGGQGQGQSGGQAQGQEGNQGQGSGTGGKEGQSGAGGESGQAGAGQGQDGSGKGMGQGTSEGQGSAGGGITPGGGGSAAFTNQEQNEGERNFDVLREEVARTRDLVKSLNELSTQVRRGSVDPELLSDITTKADEFRRSGGRSLDTEKTRGRDIGELSRDASVGVVRDAAAGEEIKQGAGERSGTTLEAAQGSPDNVRKQIESGEVDVTPEYRRIIDRYFGSLSER